MTDPKLERFRAWTAARAKELPPRAVAALDGHLGDVREVLGRYGLGEVPVETLERACAHLLAWVGLHVHHRLAEGDLPEAAHAVVEDAYLSAIGQWAVTLRALRQAECSVDAGTLEQMLSVEMGDEDRG